MGRLSLLLCLSSMVFAMFTSAETPGAPVTPKTNETPSSILENSEEKTELIGDTIHFKNGRLLAGVQIVGKYALSIELVPAPGVKALSLPLSMIESIEYDDINNADGNWLLGNDNPKGKTKLLEGKKITPELYSKINKPLFNENREFTQKDFKDLLEEVAQENNLIVVFDDSILNLRPENRKWSIQIEAGTSFLHLLENDFSKSFPEMEWGYQYDKIAIKTKTDNEKEN